MKIVGNLIGNFVGLMLRDVYTLFYFHEGLMLNLMNRLTIFLLPGIFFVLRYLPKPHTWWMELLGGKNLLGNKLNDILCLPW